jgi:hypothetical protein
MTVDSLRLTSDNTERLVVHQHMNLGMAALARWVRAKFRTERWQTVDLIVYRPAGGAGFRNGRRLRLGGKRQAAGYD